MPSTARGKGDFLRASDGEAPIWRRRDNRDFAHDVHAGRDITYQRQLALQPSTALGRTRGQLKALLRSLLEPRRATTHAKPFLLTRPRIRSTFVFSRRRLCLRRSLRLAPVRGVEGWERASKTIQLGAAKRFTCSSFGNGVN